MDKLRFLHIPKTAGSTFARILRNLYKGKKRFVFKGSYHEDMLRFAALSKDAREAVTLFTGHAPFVSGVREADEVPIITVLRDPVSRVKSFCQHVSEGKTRYLVDEYPPTRFSLDKFLHSNNSELCNLQSRMLINYEKSGSELLIDTLTPEEIKRKALDNLFNRVSCFGLQEYFDESLVYFASRLGWRAPHYEYRNRKNISRLLKFEDRHIARIIELNSIDVEMYQAAKERFLSLIESDDQLKKSIQTFKRIQRLASPAMMLYGDTGRFVKRNVRRVFGDN